MANISVQLREILDLSAGRLEAAGIIHCWQKHLQLFIDRLFARYVLVSLSCAEKDDKTMAFIAAKIFGARIYRLKILCH
jgi:hypothetical protein